MNAERLHAIALAVREDLGATEVPSLLGQLVAALNESVQNPADPGYQQQVSSLREQLAAARLVDVLGPDTSQPSRTVRLQDDSLSNARPDLRLCARDPTSLSRAAARSSGAEN